MARDFDAIIADATGTDPRMQDQRRNGQTGNGQQSSDAQQSSQTSLPSGSVGAALEPVLSMEKTDMMFWLMVLQTILLALIWLQGTR
jgi:hypothetical protein